MNADRTAAPCPSRSAGDLDAAAGEARWVLPEDGIVDPIAIEIAARGSRRVALTPTERLLAAASILAVGGTPHDIEVRLHVSGRTARTLADRARRLGGSGDRRAA
ncbi:hypothetical protein ETD83_39685 [Actinomadura soli]|uniref:Uncharacterized protein n=1 Tax=Actinomadura soli TaxID=2508997 RepID=A0A5C4IYZ9_9ACTN|nr:hypothetical protein [Actinomadura soli]TMQ87881.1 hypothetical protein ETD83_39685 [Actinomadura soli]